MSCNFFLHLGKCRSEDFESGLCEARFTKLDILYIHLNKAMNVTSALSKLQVLAKIRNTFRKDMIPQHIFVIKK